MTDDISDEQQVIQAVYRAVKNDGPVTNRELADQGLEELHHVRTITRNLDRVGKIRWSHGRSGWVVA
jgi:hypothetical protein